MSKGKKFIDVTEDKNRCQYEFRISWIEFGWVLPSPTERRAEWSLQFPPGISSSPPGHTHWHPQLFFSLEKGAEKPHKDGTQPFRVESPLYAHLPRPFATKRAIRNSGRYGTVEFGLKTPIRNLPASLASRMTAVHIAPDPLGTTQNWSIHINSECHSDNTKQFGLLYKLMPHTRPAIRMMKVAFG